MGIFDEGCMGMFNAIIPDELLHPTGVYKERLSQSALYYETGQVSDYDAQEVLNWFITKGVQFKWGQDEATELTDQAGASAVQDCTSPPCASPMTSAVTPSASSISRA